MRKIDAISKIVGTRKVAYSKEQGQAIFCNGRAFIYSAKTEGRSATQESLTVNEYVNNTFLVGGWEVTEEDYDDLDDFVFPSELTDITTSKMFKLMQVTQRDYFVCYVQDFKNNELLEVRIHAVNSNFFIDTNGSHWYNCKIGKKILEDANIFQVREEE